jgi:hypothetical protein
MSTEELPTISEAPRQSVAPINSASRLDYIIRVVLLVLAIAIPAFLGVQAVGATDLDLFWHLRTGEWILQHHAIPHADPFSWTMSGKPWQAYSWLFEVLAIKLFYRFGIIGLLGYIGAMLAAIMTALQHLIRRLQPSFGLSLLLMAAAFMGMGHLMTPRPWMFTILFFVFELDILMQARKTGKTRELLWLPLIFLLWGNLHIEFIDGLLVLGLAAAESILVPFLPKLRTKLRAFPVVAALAASALATLINPFGWKVYSVVFDYTSRLATHASALNTVTELQSNSFRDPGNYCVLFLAMAATAALARQHRFLFFETCLLVFATIESFRSQRDVWLVVISSVAILAACIPDRMDAAARRPGAVPLVLAGPGAVLLVFLLLWSSNSDQRALDAELATALPVHAVEAIQAQGYSGPVYNDYNWGGYLMWSLRMPVSIDGRASFYGDTVIDRSVATWNAEPDWASDPALASAGIVIGPVKAPLFQVLKTDPHFKLAYEDKMATVYVARR